jgi:hypothetical protein
MFSVFYLFNIFILYASNNFFRVVFKTSFIQNKFYIFRKFFKFVVSNFLVLNFFIIDFFIVVSNYSFIFFIVYLLKRKKNILYFHLRSKKCEKIKKQEKNFSIFEVLVYFKFFVFDSSKNLFFDCFLAYKHYFLRKELIFSKGRYSRNRQVYRTGVYWCLYINILAVVALYY